MVGSVAGGLERLIPASSRRTNQVYSVPEQMVFAQPGSPDTPSTRISFINDNQQLEDFLENCKKIDQLERRTASKSVLRKLLEASSISLKFYKVDLAKLNMLEKVTPTGLADFDYIVLREDTLRDVRIGEFLEFFCRTPPLRQPQVLFLPNDGDSSLFDRLRYANPEVTVVDLATEGRGPVALTRSEPQSLVDFTDLYEGRCFDIAGSASMHQLDRWTAQSNRLSQLAIFILRSRARLLSSERHDVEPEIDALLRRIEAMTSTAVGDEMDIMLSLRITVLLQKLFCSEDPKYLVEAISLATALGDDFGFAACLRYAEFLDVHPALRDHMYERAKTIFRQHEATELTLHCENNRLVSRFVWRLPEVGDFEALVRAIAEEQPGLYRRHDIYYNAGVRHLFGGQVAAAHEAFVDPCFINARPLIRSCARLGAMICRYVGGDALDPQHVLDDMDAMLREVQPSNKWHITNLLLNLMLLIRDHPSALAEAKRMAEPGLILKDRLDVRDEFAENSRMGALLGLSATVPTSRIPGTFGEFQDRYGFAVPYFFIWS